MGKHQPNRHGNGEGRAPFEAFASRPKPLVSSVAPTDKGRSSIAQSNANDAAHHADISFLDIPPNPGAHA
jgi:hypothetical protein